MTHSPRLTDRQILQHLRRTGASSIGDTERLANISTDAERRELWFRHRQLFDGPTQPLFDAVMLDCRRRIAAAVHTGTLSLWPRSDPA